jgi:hypothetical protein
VLQEKISISNYLWAFPGQASTKLKHEEVELTRMLEALTVCPDFVSCDVAIQVH